VPDPVLFQSTSPPSWILSGCSLCFDITDFFGRG
jgi:hypothetical protein